ncbi:phage tail protein [Streptococcus uberis]|nr:phage tail protein [Streptococcus uberis]MCK1198538.1 phage tail protein [Streptococcus uberis]
MTTFLDHKDNEYEAQTVIKATNAVNGERSLTGTIYTNEEVLNKIDKGWKIKFQDEFYRVIFAKPIDTGNKIQVDFDAVHQFFYDFDKSSVHSQLQDGSHTFQTYLNFIFDGSGYSYNLEVTVNALNKQSFGYKSRLDLFNDIVKSSGIEFFVSGKVVRILQKTGTDLSTIVRKNFNMNELGIEKKINDFVTYQKGFGAWNNKDDHSKGRLEVEYISPLASEYGIIEAEPLVDERYTNADSLLASLKQNVDSSYSISVQIDMEDLTKAGYQYTQPVAGDYIMAINETVGFKEKIRIVSFTSEYDVTGKLISHKVTCNDIGTVKKQSNVVNRLSGKLNSNETKLIEIESTAKEALVSADGKNTNYYGTEMPVDSPKGTLKTGDLLFLTVGDTTKQYYWNGAEWIINPFSNDIDFVKNTINTDINPLLERLNLDLSHNIEKTNSNEVALTNANELITTTQNDLTSTKNSLLLQINEVNALSTRNSDAINIAKSNLQTEIDNLETQANQTISDLTKTKADLLAQADTMNSLTSRVTDVETTANGTKTTVTQLSKSVNDLTGSVDGVTQEVKTVQDNLDGVYTTLSKIQVGGNNLAVGTSSEYTTPKTTWTGGTNQVVAINKVYTGGLSVSDDIYLSIQIKASGLTGTSPKIMVQGPGDTTSWSPPWTASVQNDLIEGEQWLRYGFKITADQLKNSYFTLQLRFDNISGGSVSWRNLKVEKGTIATAWTPAIQDSSIEMANYKQTIDTQLTDLKRTTETNANTIETNRVAIETTVDGIKTDISSLQLTNSSLQSKQTTLETSVDGIKTDISVLNTYMNDDGTRTTALQEYSKTETANQLAMFRTEVSNTYASKAQVTSDINGLTAKYENIRVGSRNYVLKSDIYLQQGTPNVFFTFSDDFVKNATGKTIVLSYEVESSNLSLRASGNRYGFEIKISFTDGTAGYYGLWMSGTTALTNRRVIKSYNLPPDKVVSKVEYGIMSIQIDGTIKIGRPQIEIATTASDWQPAQEDVKDYTSTKIAEYKQTVDQNYASLSSEVGMKVNASIFNQTVDSINTTISTLSTDFDSTKMEFQTVKQTSELYQRVIGSTETSIKTNVTNIIATSEVIQTTVERISNLEVITADADTNIDILNSNITNINENVSNLANDQSATKTTVTQLADSYAVKTLNNSGDVLSSLNLNSGGVKIKGNLIHLDGTTLIDNGIITNAMIKDVMADKISAGTIDAAKVNLINLNANNIVTGTISANIVKGGFLNSLNGTTSFDLNSGKLYFYNNNTGVFRNDQNASVMGIKFSNNQITVNNTSRTLSRVIVGGDRRETTLDDGRWDQGGFSGIIIETVKGINSPDHWGADRVNVIGDTIRFVHTYNTDTTGTGLNSMGWVMENYVGTSTIQGSIVLRPEGIDQRNSYIFLGDVRLYNGGTKGNYYLRDVIRSLRTCFQHIVNGGTSSDAINAIKSELTRYSNI